MPYIYAGLQLVSPGLFAILRARLQMNVLWNRALERGRLRAVVHDGLWFHLSTPADLSQAEYLLSLGATGETR